MIQFKNLMQQGKAVTIADIAIFAHNEETMITAMMSELAQQTVFTDSSFSAVLSCSRTGAQTPPTASRKLQPSSFPIRRL